jgi:hypothetical protein
MFGLWNDGFIFASLFSMCSMMHGSVCRRVLRRAGWYATRLACAVQDRARPPVERQELTMRKVVLAFPAILVATLFFPIGSVNAQNYPWCGERGDGSTNCGFVSYEQCRVKLSLCYRNPMFQPPTGEPRSRRRP